MMIILDRADFDSLSERARNEIIARWEESKVSAPPESLPPVPVHDAGLYVGVDMTDVVDLTFKQVREWMSAASDKTKVGLRVIAEHGPVVSFERFNEAGIENLSHFQSRTTMRTRTITGDTEAFMLGWDEWDHGKDGQVTSGHYAVTPITHQSLRRYFGLE